jgi:hypothetical protein
MNFKMPSNFKKAYFAEIDNYKTALNENRKKDAWLYLERAHIIGQYHPVPHTGIHFRMLVFALKNWDTNEIVGQLVRLLVGWFGSLMNRVPIGNTGSANMPILARRAIPEDLMGLLANADTSISGLAGLKKNSQS